MDTQINLRNILICDNNIQEILKIGDIHEKINNIKLYQIAFTHKSYINTNINNIYNYNLINDVVPFQKYSNERLEFLGDSIIGHIICEYLYDRYPNNDEGFLTKLKTRLVDRKSLSKFANYLNLSKYILISNHMENIHGRNTNKILEDIFESFIGALTKDLGYNIAKKFVLNILESTTNFSQLLYNDINYKDRLLRYFQKQGWGPPVYTINLIIGPPHKRTFTIDAWIHEYLVDDKENKNLIRKELVGRGLGLSKKDAEQIASKNALIKFNLLDENN